MEVLRREEDFYDLGMEYFGRAMGMGVVYCEVMFDVQAHTRRGVGIEVVLSGLRRARKEAERTSGVSINNPCSSEKNANEIVENKLYSVSPERPLS